MPNWAYNYLHVSGQRKEIEELKSKIISNDGIDLTVFAPTPAILKDTQSPWAESPEPHPNWANLLANGEITQEWHDHLIENRRKNHEAGIKAFEETGYHSWYEWSIANWGTKWPPSEAYIIEYADTIEIRFHTPWSPPVKLIETIASKNPELTFVLSFTEESMAYVGTALYRNGKFETEISFDFNEASDLPEPFATQYTDAVSKDDDERYDALQEIYESLAQHCESQIHFFTK